MTLNGQIAAAHRIISFLGMGEGVDGHISARDESTPGTMLLTPYPMHWSTIYEHHIPVVSLTDGKVIAGEYILDEPAWFVHGALQRRSVRHRVFIHAHPPEATAIACSSNGRLLPIHQHVMSLYNEISYLDEYHGEVLSMEYGEKIADALGSKSILFLANHGVIVGGGSIPKALRRLYYLERACLFQNKLFSAGLSPKYIKEEYLLPANLGTDLIQDQHAENLFRSWSALC